MWLAIFAIAIAVSIGLIVAAIVMRDRDATGAQLTLLSTENASLKTDPIDPDLTTLVASPEVRSVMRADHIAMPELLAELNAIAVQRRKNANPIVTFDMAVHRLRNVSEMMDRLGFDAETLARTDLNVGSVFRACEMCPADEVCHDWLVRAPKSYQRAPAFCPNAERFARAREVTA